ncbi:MAG: hypothetical protein KBB84_08270 [Spirochaetes bacterium]|jgi:hypothetical protein|nr:hypothetical protein [Spirochaetota bacterium]
MADRYWNECLTELDKAYHIEREIKICAISSEIGKEIPKDFNSLKDVLSAIISL